MTDERWAELKDRSLLDRGMWPDHYDEVVAYVDALRSEVADLAPLRDFLRDMHGENVFVESGAARERAEMQSLLKATRLRLLDIERKQRQTGQMTDFEFVVECLNVMAGLEHTVRERGPILPPLDHDRAAERIAELEATIKHLVNYPV